MPALEEIALRNFSAEGALLARTFSCRDRQRMSLAALCGCRTGGCVQSQAQKREMQVRKEQRRRDELRMTSKSCVVKKEKSPQPSPSGGPFSQLCDNL